MFEDMIHYARIRNNEAHTNLVDKDDQQIFISKVETNFDCSKGLVTELKKKTLRNMVL